MTVPAASWRSRRFCAASSRLCCSFCAALIELFPPARHRRRPRSPLRRRDRCSREGARWARRRPCPVLGAVEVLALTGRMGCAGGCPAGRASLSPYDVGRTGRDRVRSWRVVPSLRRGAYGESLDGRETRARTTGNSPSNARTEREHRPRARVSRRGWTERAGHRSRTAPARAREVAEKARCERSGRTGRGSPWDEKGAASAGYAPARIRDERAGDSPHGATFVAVTLHVERILVEEHVDACEAPPRPRTTVVRPDEGARAFPMVDRSTRDERVLGLIPGTRSL